MARQGFAGHPLKTKDVVYWEAWDVPSGWATAKSSDSYTLETKIKDTPAFPCSQGPYTVTGSAEFYEGLAIPKTFKMGAVEEAGLLHATRQSPGLFPGGSGAISHSIRVDWKCCPNPAKSTPKPIDTTPRMD